MPVTSLEIKLFKSLLMPGDDASEAGGGISTNEVFSNEMGAWFPRISPNYSTTNRVQHQKLFLKNSSSSDGFYNGMASLVNGVVDLSSNSIVSVRVNGSNDAVGTTVRVMGINASGSFTIEDIEIDGSTSFVDGAITWSSVLAAIALDSGSGDPKNMLENTVDIYNSIESIGVIPANHHSAVGFITIGFQATTGGTSSVTDRTVAPSGITFSKPVSGLSTVTIGSTGIIPASTSIALWGKETLPPGMSSIPNAEVVLGIIGESGGV
jgi:hypothetical protein